MIEKIKCPKCKIYMKFVNVGGMGASNYSVLYMVCNNPNCLYFRILRYIQTNEGEFIKSFGDDEE